MTDRRRLVVVGNGMVGHKLLETVADLQSGADAAGGPGGPWEIVTFCEEPRPAYDRVGLSSFFTGSTADDLSLVAPGFFERHGITVHLGDRVGSIDTEAHTVTSDGGRTIRYDALVLATGSYPFVPPVAGRDAKGTFVYRTIDDLEAMAEAALRPGASVGTVIGGGLLGLEAANALRAMGLETHVVEFAPRLMPVQVDEGGGRALRRQIEALGVRVHLGHATTEIVAGDDGWVSHLTFAHDDHADLATDVLVFSAGIRPRDDIAGAAGIELGERGGIVVDELLRTSAPDVWAIGECALVGGRIYGLVAPGYDMARSVARQLTGGVAEPFTGADMSTKLKLLGVDVASFGDAHATTDGAHEIVWDDPRTDVYKKLVVSGDGAVLGGVLVGDATAYGSLVQMARGDMPTPEHPEALILPDLGLDHGGNGAALVGVGALADTATICSCENVTKGSICSAIGDGRHELGALKATTRAGTGCGGCVPLMTDVLRDELARAGVELDRSLCEHFPVSRQDLFSLVQVHGYQTFGEVLARHGTGRGCEICKPTVASILATCTNRYILDDDQAALQDTNDHFLANLQRDGTYSVVPRIPGGEVTPEGLITIGEVARDFGLYTKITGGQRVDLFGARVEQLPPIWKRLVDAGFESGHAYGKSLRTVKSCVGQTWCRYGVQDSTSMAIALELRYRGLRSPHKIKMGVSGCSRECAEAQSKDVGVIATERGWNLYLGGNGGQRPRHAVLFAEDLYDDELVRLIDRFLMFYVRTADRLQRTASWLEQLDGGVDHLRRVIVDDALDLCRELDEQMARHVATYECEWKATLERPERVARFVSFVNAPDEPDPTIVFVEERGQIRPATPDERLIEREVAVAIR
ncbi:MAG: nitrite reductase large subunit NirB [Acidimicrobiales bacterium]